MKDINNNSHSAPTGGILEIKRKYYMEMLKQGNNKIPEETEIAINAILESYPKVYIETFIEESCFAEYVNNKEQDLDIKGSYIEKYVVPRLEKSLEKFKEKGIRIEPYIEKYIKTDISPYLEKQIKKWAEMALEKYSKEYVETGLEAENFVKYFKEEYEFLKETEWLFTKNKVKVKEGYIAMRLKPRLEEYLKDFEKKGMYIKRYIDEYIETHIKPNLESYIKPYIKADIRRYLVDNKEEKYLEEVLKELKKTEINLNSYIEIFTMQRIEPYLKMYKDQGIDINAYTLKYTKQYLKKYIHKKQAIEQKEQENAIIYKFVSIHEQYILKYIEEYKKTGIDTQKYLEKYLKPTFEDFVVSHKEYSEDYIKQYFKKGIDLFIEEYTESCEKRLEQQLNIAINVKQALQEAEANQNNNATKQLQKVNQNNDTDIEKQKDKLLKKYFDVHEQYVSRYTEEYRKTGIDIEAYFEKYMKPSFEEFAVEIQKIYNKDYTEDYIKQNYKEYMEDFTKKGKEGWIPRLQEQLNIVINIKQALKKAERDIRVALEGYVLNAVQYGHGAVRLEEYLNMYKAKGRNIKPYLKNYLADYTEKYLHTALEIVLEKYTEIGIDIKPYIRLYRDTYMIQYYAKCMYIWRYSEIIRHKLETQKGLKYEEPSEAYHTEDSYMTMWLEMHKCKYIEEYEKTKMDIKTYIKKYLKPRIETFYRNHDATKMHVEGLTALAIETTMLELNKVLENHIKRKRSINLKPFAKNAAELGKKLMEFNIKNKIIYEEYMNQNSNLILSMEYMHKNIDEYIMSIYASKYYLSKLDNEDKEKFSKFIYSYYILPYATNVIEKEIKKLYEDLKKIDTKFIEEIDTKFVNDIKKERIGSKAFNKNASVKAKIKQMNSLADAVVKQKERLVGASYVKMKEFITKIYDRVTISRLNEDVNYNQVLQNSVKETEKQINKMILAEMQKINTNNINEELKQQLFSAKLKTDFNSEEFKNKVLFNLFKNAEIRKTNVDFYRRAVITLFKEGHGDQSLYDLLIKREKRLDKETKKEIQDLLNSRKVLENNKEKRQALKEKVAEAR